MKYVNYYSILIILLVTACDNYDISTKQAETFVRYYGVGLEDEGMKVITTNEGYLIMANVKNPGSGRDICIITTDKYGNTTAPVTTIGGAFDDIGYAIKPRGEGYIIAGSSQTSQSGNKHIYFVQIRADGSVDWEIPPIDTLNSNEALDVLVPNSTELIFTGYTERGEAASKRAIYYLKYDTSKDRDSAIVVFNLQKNDNYDLVANSITYLEGESTYVFAGYRSNAETKYIYLLQWDGSTGGTLPLTISTDGTSEAISIINGTEEGSCWVACNHELSSTESEILLYKTYANFSNTETPRSLGERSMNRVQSIALHGNSLFLCGTSSSGELQYGDMTIIRFNENSPNPQYIYIGDGTSYTGNGFDLTNESGYVVTGAGYLNEKSMIALYKVNSEGNLW